MSSRGKITPEVQEMCQHYIGREITTTELRLVPYVHFESCNHQKLDPNKISPEERKILQQWREEGLIEGGASGLRISRKFWDWANECLWLSYVGCTGRIDDK